MLHPHGWTRVPTSWIGWTLITCSVICTNSSTPGTDITFYKRPSEHGVVDRTSTDGSNKLCYHNYAQTPHLHERCCHTCNRSTHSTNLTSQSDVTHKDVTYTLQATLDYPSFSTPLVSLFTYREMYKTLEVPHTILPYSWETDLTEILCSQHQSYNELIKFAHRIGRAHV